MRGHFGDEAIAAGKNTPTWRRVAGTIEWSHVWKFAALTVALSLLAVGFSRTLASDHADPTSLAYPEANITDLFFFPKGDRMILVFDVRRSLRKAGPYNLEPFTFDINMDFTTEVSFDSPPDRARYGGTIEKPERIHADATIRLLLRNDAKLKKIDYLGTWGDKSGIEVFVGVRDDPFVFPRFFDRNTIATVISIPISSFPAGQRDFILWATTMKGAELIDHVGRSVRSQLPRFGFLNTLPPSEHRRKLMEEEKFWNDIFNFFRTKREAWSRGIADLIQFTFLIRPYDRVPDVMIYSNRFPAGYPNGRLLTDDVVAQTCAIGDCLLQELSFIEAKRTQDGKEKWPRATSNDKPLLDQWPFLAEPFSAGEEPPPPNQSIWGYVIFTLLVVAIAFWALVEIFRRLILRLWNRLRPAPSASATATPGA